MLMPPYLKKSLLEIHLSSCIRQLIDLPTYPTFLMMVDSNEAKGVTFSNHYKLFKIRHFVHIWVCLLEPFAEIASTMYVGLIG